MKAQINWRYVLAADAQKISIAIILCKKNKIDLFE